MKYHVFTIHDSAIDAFLRPFYAVAVGQATRIFTDEINNNQSEMHKHPEDYILYSIGTWDDQTGQHDSKQPNIVVRGKDCLTS